MAQPIFVGSTKNNSSAATSLTVTRSCTAGNTLVVGIALSDGSQHVSAITDSAGSVGGVPVNQWQPIAKQKLNGASLEYWACRNIAAISSLSIALSGSQGIAAIVGEYSGVNAFGVNATFEVNSTENPFPNNDIVLGVSEQAVASEIMVTFFSVLDVGIVSAQAGTLRDSYSFSSGSVPSIALVDQANSDPTDLLDCGITIAQAVTTTTGGITTNNIPASSLQAITLLLSGGLTLRSIPGFTDIPDANFAAGQVVRGINLAKIAENAEFGMVRFEIFSGTYTDGETVDLPVSPVDGYAYSREELIYGWALWSSVDASTGWASAQEALWYCQWSVDQWEGPDSPGGGVHCNEWYTWIHSNQPNTQTSDGILQVFVLAQRGAGGSYTAQPGGSGYTFPGGSGFTTDLTMAAAASYSPLADSSFAQDDPLTQAIAQQLNENAKFGAVNVEAFYCGEFINGQTVPQLVSPVDGYTYPYANTAFLACPRWTTGGSAYTQPQSGLFLQDLAECYVSAVGVVSCEMSVWGGGPIVVEPTWGRCAVIAICQRPVSGTPYTIGNQFSEIDLTRFMPGTDLEAALLKQINDNTQEAISCPEIFGPTNYVNGQTVALPVSTRDGYEYSRAELYYVWGIHSTATPSSNRMITLQSSVNSAGLVTIAEYRLPHGGVGTLYNDGSLDVIVVAIRNGTGRIGTPIIGTGGATPPSDLASPTPGGVASITVNGV